MKRRAAITGGWLLLLASVASSNEPTSGGPVAPGGYADRLIDGGRLSPDIVTDGFAGNDPEGWPRSFGIQLTTSGLSRDEYDSDESGIRVGGMLDTPDYGAFTLDANWRASDSYGFGSGGLFTLLQRGLPVDGGWSVNNALGVFNTPAADLSRRQYRFFVPTIPTGGLSSEWIHDGDLAVYAAAGQPGLFTGVYVPAFESLGGRLATGGLQWNASARWSAALQMVDVSDVDLSIGSGSETGRLSAQSWYGALAWSAADARAQVNIIDSVTNGDTHRSGAWLDAAIRSDRLWHNAGAFVLGSNLTWGNQPLSSDMQGGYYRASYQDRRWMLNGGVDYIEPTSGDRSPTVYLTGDVRHQYRAGLGVGGGGNMREGPTDAWSAFVYVDRQNRWGLGRSQVDYGRDEDRWGAQLTLDQTWNVQAGRRLTTALIASRAELEYYTTDALGFAINGGGDIARNLSLDANVRYDKAFGDAASDDLMANVALNWSFAPGWMLSASYYENHLDGRLPIVAPLPIPGPGNFVEQNLDDSGYYVTLRYDWQAGSRNAPLGGPASRGSGSISGVIYLDANDNGRMDAGETGAPNVVVLLDGRFAARTDSEGRFLFPSVAVAGHFLTVIPDNLPLPWTVPGDRIDVRVAVRDDTRVEIPARRTR